MSKHYKCSPCRGPCVLCCVFDKCDVCARCVVQQNGGALTICRPCHDAVRTCIATKGVMPSAHHPSLFTQFKMSIELWF